ncbi:MAG: DUF5009 domain-containing protein [Chitinophagia bacterium]|nr:DUF5009 domain-containing protein [Chitinophagia bacterium]
MSTNNRFLALDVFRGLTICFMIIVNTPGDGDATFAALLHAEWHGFTPTDLVFPSFLFAVGNALSFVMPRWQQKSNGEVLRIVSKRAAIIFLLGFLMYWFPFFTTDSTGHWMISPFNHTRIMGVLQRIALCYWATAMMVHFFNTRSVLFISGFFLLFYWAALSWFGSTSDPFGITSNAGYYLDKWLMGEAHMYQGEGFPFDPEGWLSTLPAIVNVVIGYYAGVYLQKQGRTYQALTHLLLAGFVLLLIAYCWNFWLPINKKLWTSSFVMLTTGLDLVIISVIIYWIDMRKQTSGAAFFETAGKNPLAIYLFSELFAVTLHKIPIHSGLSLFQWIYINLFSFLGPYFGSLAFAIAFMLVCWSLGYWMDKKKLYLRV